MQKQTMYENQMPAGAERYGAPRDIESIALMPSYIIAGTELAPPSGVEYVPPIEACTIIRDNDERCRAPKAKGTDFCIGHLRAMEKAAAAAEKENESK